jgi:drug/metabolite transporter (DMT)-like permease
MIQQTIIHKEHRLAGQGAIFLCAILWSTSGLFIRLVDWHPMVIAGLRSLLAAFVLLALKLLVPGRVSGITNRAEYFRTLVKDSPSLTVYGLSYAVTIILFVTANKLTASANVIMLQYAAPVWAALLGWFFLKERPHWEQWCAIIMVSVGMFLVFSGGLTAGSLLGDTLALFSGITFAANSVVLRVRKDGNTADVMLFSHILCVVASIPFIIMHPPTISVHSMLCISFMGIIQLGLATALFAYGIKRITAVQAMLTATIEPVLNPIWVLLIIGERPTLSVIAGGSIIIAAVLFSSTLSTLRRRS